MKITIHVDDKLISELAKSYPQTKRSFVYEQLFKASAYKALKDCANLTEAQKIEYISKIVEV